MFFFISKVNYSIVSIVSRSDCFVSVFLHLLPVVVKSDLLDLYAFNVSFLFIFLRSEFLSAIYVVDLFSFSF